MNKADIEKALQRHINDRVFIQPGNIKYHMNEAYIKHYTKMLKEFEKCQH